MESTCQDFDLKLIFDHVEKILNSDPYNVDAQRKIEEMIRQEAVLENMEHAMEYSVSTFMMIDG